MRADWAVGQWGGACGPAPSGTGAPGGVVTVTQQGSELTMSGAGRTFSTSECWEQFPGLVRMSHSSGARAWRSSCRTPPGDPRQASLVTTITATDTTISFDETGQYQFIINGQNCTASVRRARVMSLVQREGESAPATPAADTAVPAADTPASAASAVGASPKPRACAELGAPERLEVRPSRKLLRAGESFQFRAVLLDAAGCALEATPTFRVVTPDAPLTVTARGAVSVPDSALESTVELQASFSDRSVRVLVEIASAERYDALLARDGLNAAGESNEAAVTRIATSSIGSGTSTAHDDSGRRRALFVGVVGGVAMVLGLLGFVLMQRSRAEQARPEPRRSRLPPTLTPVHAPPLGKTCPTCREEYPADAEFCPNDGNRLVPVQVQVGGEPSGPTGGVCPVCGQGFDPGVNQCPKHGEELVPVAARVAVPDETAAETKKICPVCGKYFPSESQFCGGCGASLVQVN